MRTVAGLALGGPERSLAVNAHFVLLSLLLGRSFPAQEMADAAVDRGDLAVGIAFYINMAFGAGKVAVHRLLKRCAVHITFHAFLSVAGIAIVPGIHGSRKAEKKGEYNERSA